MVNRAIMRQHTNPLQGYKEKHHILPKSMGGGGDWKNLVELTAREHFLAHWMLWRIHRNKQMAFAFTYMRYGNDKQPDKYYSSKGFEAARKAVSEVQTGTTMPQGQKDKISQTLKGRPSPMKGKVPWNKGVPRSKETKEKLRLASTGRKYSEDTKRKLSEINSGEGNGFYGKNHTEETIKKMREKNHLSRKVFCENNGETYISASEAARQLVVSKSVVIRICTGKTKNSKTGLKLKYVD